MLLLLSESFFFSTFLIYRESAFVVNAILFDLLDYLGVFW